MSFLPGEFTLASGARDDDEGLFSRDLNGQLVRLDAPTETDYDDEFTIRIDGTEVPVRRAEPLKDERGNIILDLNGRTTPRYTTIYDAALSLYVKNSGDEEKLPIPTLCHQPHMTPVAVCRLCVVQIYREKRGERAAERKLLPACQHRVDPGMEVFTQKAPGSDGDRVRKAVEVLTDLLAADHLKPAPAPAPAADLAPFNELQRLVDRQNVTGSRFRLDVLKRPSETNVASLPSKGHGELDSSSPVFLVDHSACILCDRCSRACDDVKKNDVIGRVGKGATANIGFDLDDPMGNSSCVQCGECMVSCPTSAITFKPVGRVKQSDGSVGLPVPTAELVRDPLFHGVSAKFLLWQEGLVLRRQLKAGDSLCHQGDAGHSAFLIRNGELEITAWPTDKGGRKSSAKGGLLALFPSRRVEVVPKKRFTRTAKDVIVGEMSCLNGTPRTADICALKDSEVWEIRRNVLDRMIRSPAQRELFESKHRTAVMDVVFRQSDVFRELPGREFQDCVDFLRPRLSFLSVSPRQAIFQQGTFSEDFYFIRLGHVRVTVNRPGDEPIITSVGPGTVIGEIGILAMSPDDLSKPEDQIVREIQETLSHRGPGELPMGRRSATCTSLDHVQLVRVARGDMLHIAKRFPTILERLVKLSMDRLRADTGVMSPTKREYLNQGLYQGNSLLVLDLDNCTRCDDCTRACIEQHGNESHGLPITRLLRDGLRFENYLVATSCRSCKDAYCMIGCPVDAIHRGKHEQIVIEDHCIGCGLCAENCPYGNIWMMPNEHRKLEAPDPTHPGQTHLVAQPKAATCDLCDAEGKHDEPLPRCVQACPHDAAHRMSGEELLHRIIPGA